jgi:hypothetical protein
MVTNNEMQPVAAITPADIVQEIDKTLGRLLKQATLTGDEKAAARIHHTRKLTRVLFQHMDATNQAAAAALQTVTAQRDQIAAELADVTNAIDQSITYHPRLEKLVDEIHQEIQDDALEYADEQQEIRAADFLHQELGMSYPAAKVYAGEIIELLYNDTAPTPEQVEAFEALCATIDLPDWIGKAKPDDDESAE